MTIKHIFPPNSHWCNASEYFKGRSHYTFHSIDFHSYTLMPKIGNAISRRFAIRCVPKFGELESEEKINISRRVLLAEFKILLEKISKKAFFFAF